MEYCDKIQELERRIQVLEKEKEENQNSKIEKTPHDIDGFDPEFFKDMQELDHEWQICNAQYKRATNKHEKEDIEYNLATIEKEKEEVCIREYGRIKEAVKHIPFGYIALCSSWTGDTSNHSYGYRYEWAWSLTEPTNAFGQPGYENFIDTDLETYQKIQNLMTKFNLYKVHPKMIDLDYKIGHVDSKSRYPLCFKCGGYDTKLFTKKVRKNERKEER